MKQISLLSAVTIAVEKHLPASKKMPDPFGIHKRQSQAWASQIIDADIYNPEPFDFSHDVDRIIRILQSLRPVNQELDELSQASIRMIELMSGMKLHELQNEIFLISTAIENAIIASQDGKTDQSNQEHATRYKQPTGRKRNWRAVSVAHCCRRIWAEAEFASNPKKYGTVILNALHPQGGDC